MHKIPIALIGVGAIGQTHIDRLPVAGDFLALGAAVNVD